MGDNILEVFNKLLNSKVKNFGVAPGTITESIVPVLAEVNLIQYDQNDFIKEKIIGVDSIETKLAALPRDHVTWLDVENVKAPNILRKIGEVFNIHPLILEDISNLHQRPKFEDNEDYLYLVVNMIQLDTNKKDILNEQVSFLVFKNLLITFQEKPGDVFDLVRRRLETAKGKIRKMPTDYLLYALLDIILDNYFIVLNSLNDQINKLSVAVDKRPDNKTIYEVQKLKQKLLNMNRYITPTKELIWTLVKTESEIMNEDTEIYFKDLSDHILQINDSLEVLRDSLVGLLQYANSIISNKLNEIMKVLTVVSTIFIPLNFIASIYGMNFHHMPELDYYYGYYIIVAVMFSLGISMFAYFKLKKWI